MNEEMLQKTQQMKELMKWMFAGPGADGWPATPKAARGKIRTGQRENEVFCDQNPLPM